MDVVNKIFTSATDKRLSDYVNIIFMDRPDWNEFKPKLSANTEEGKSFDAIHLGGLIIVGAERDDRILPLMFHEIGHSLYPPANDNFTDELRAYYFQRVSTEILHKQLRQIELPYSYPDYNKDDMFPSKAHMDAYKSAAGLYAYQTLPLKMVEQVNPDLNRRMEELLSFVKSD